MSETGRDHAGTPRCAHAGALARSRVNGLARFPLPLLLLPVLLLPSCIERRIRITSEPPGALVHLNDVEIGRTPVETSFTFHGIYDVRLDLEGYEPVWAAKKATAPLYEVPGIDLVATALPVTFRNHQSWHFDLEPTPETAADPDDFEAGLLERANDLRQQVD